MRRLFGCPDIVSLTEKFLMARNFYRIFTENNPVMGDSKTFGIPEAKGLTSSHRMPSGHAQILPIDNRRTFKHAFRFLRGWPGALSTHHTWRTIVRPDVYTRNCLSESMGLRFGGPGQKALQTMTEFTLFVDFCLIPLSKTSSFDVHVPAKKL